MNFRMTGKYLSYLVWAMAIFMLPPALVSFLYREPHAVFSLLAAIGICAGIGLVFFLLCRTATGSIYAREGLVIAGAGWIIVSLLGALPFVLSGEIPHYIDAFFETVSGFTTTGASILTDVEAMSHGLLFWRSFTHWLGGIGVLAFVLAIVRAQGGAGFSLHLLRAESPGPQVGKMLPKTHQSVRFLFLIYLVLSLINLSFLLAGRMPLFDALCTMFGTAGTGGFGIKADSMASYSPYLQNVCTVFMALFGVNFSLYFLLVRKEWKAALKDEELHVYVGIMLSTTALITLSLVLQHTWRFQDSLHHAAFTVSSIMSTTGFAISDFDLWPQFSRALLLIVMVCGTMAGSTGGGFKSARLLIVFKSVKAGLHRMRHPRSVKTVRVNGKPLEESVIQGTNLFLAVYCGIILLFFALLSIDGLSLETNLSAVLSCFNNIGPGLGLVGPTSSYAPYSYFSKTILSIAMLLGRLEIFPILLLLLPSTWRRKA